MIACSMWIAGLPPEGIVALVAGSLASSASSSIGRSFRLGGGCAGRGRRDGSRVPSRPCIAAFSYRGSQTCLGTRDQELRVFAPVRLR